MPRSRLALDRRRFLATGAAAGALASGLAMPAFSRAAARPVFTHGVQSGDVDTASRHDLDARRPPGARDDRGRRRPRASPIRSRLPPLDALPESDFAVKRLLDRPAVRPGHLLPHVAADLADINARLRADRRPLPHRAGLAAQRPLRLVGRHRRPGLGHRRRPACRPTRTIAEPHARLLPAFRRHDLRRRRHEGRGRAARRRQLDQQRADRRQAQGRRDAAPNTATSGNTT